MNDIKQENLHESEGFSESIKSSESNSSLDEELIKS